MMFQIAGVLVLFLIPLLYTQALPRAVLNFYGTLVTPIPLTYSPTLAKAPPQSEIRQVRLIDHGVLYQPKYIPPRVTMFPEAELPPKLPVIFLAMARKITSGTFITRSTTASGIGPMRSSRRYSDLRPSV